MSRAAIDNQYDNIVKNLLANKPFLAHILKGCVSEFRDIDIETIMAESFESEPEVSKVRVDRPLFLEGGRTEDVTIDEGTVTFDVRADVVVPGTDRELKFIINVESTER